jgi:transposase
MKNTSKRGRPTALTPAVQKDIYNAIAAGAYVSTAAAIGGISERTLFAWMRRGAEEPDGIYGQFVQSIKKGLAMAEMKYVLVIGEAAKEHWQAAAWMLERRFRKNWARNPEDSR